MYLIRFIFIITTDNNQIELTLLQTLFLPLKATATTITTTSQLDAKSRIISLFPTENPVENRQFILLLF